MALEEEWIMLRRKTANVVLLATIIAIAVVALLVEIAMPGRYSLSWMARVWRSPTPSAEAKKAEPSIVGWAPSPSGGVAAVAVATGDRPAYGSRRARGYIVDLNARTHAKPKCFSAQIGGFLLWNPKGTTVAYQTRDDRLRCYSCATGRTDVIAESGDYPEWILDGQSIAVRRGNSTSFHGTQFTILGVGRARGSRRLPHVDLIASGGHVWSSKRQRLACILQSPVHVKRQPGGYPDQCDVYLIDPNSGRITQVSKVGTVVPYQCPIWSPDGRSLAYTTSVTIYSKKHRADGCDYSLVVHDLDSGKRQVLTLRYGEGGSGNDLLPLQWSPDGRRMLLESSRVVGGPGMATDLFVMEWPSTKLSPLTIDGESSMACWSSDGKAIMYVHDGREIWRMNSDGTSAHRLWSLSSLPSPVSN